MTAHPPCTLVFASDRGGVIGKAGGLPWHLPKDLAHFKRVTMGHAVLLGRRTFESIGRPLPGRRNLVLTRDQSVVHDGVVVCHDLAAVQQHLRPGERLMVIGGAEVYRATMPWADTIEWTLVDTEVQDGDARVALPAPPSWREVHREDVPADERNAFAMSFRRLVRDGAP